MRQERTVQASMFDLFAGHEIGRESKAMSDWLDGHRELLSLVATDLRRHGVEETGRQGLPAEAVLRSAWLQQHRRLSYQELAFHLEDSASLRACARLPGSWSPKTSVLHETIGAIRAATWEQLDRALLVSAREEKLEHAAVVRLDSTVTAALVHEPSDSSLLWDAARVMVRLLREADALVGGTGLSWHDHRRLAKKRARAQPRPAPTGSAVPRADRGDSGHLGRPESSSGAADHGERPGGRALASQGPPPERFPLTWTHPASPLPRPTTHQWYPRGGWAGEWAGAVGM